MYRYVNSSSKIIFIPQEIAHHAKNSSMDALLSYFPEETAINLSTFKSVSKIVLPKAFAKIPRIISNHKYYSRSGFLLELFLGISLRLEKKTGKIIHFLNLGNDYNFLSLFGQKNFITGTIHQPPVKFNKCNPNPWYMEHLSGIVMIAPSQKEYTERFKNCVKHLIPHGVNTDLFRPAQNGLPGDLNQLNILFTGSHLRDFNSLARIIDYITSRDEKVYFTVVTRPEKAKYIRSKISYTGGRLRYFTNLSIDKYVRKFQEADLFLLPLIDVTATNSLNEALASGLPIVTNDMGDVRWYTKNCDGVVLFKKGDWLGMAEWIMDFRHHSHRLAKMGKASREKAEKFLDWYVVAKQYQTFFDTVLRK